jgi:predicted nucleotidyltransferase
VADSSIFGDREMAFLKELVGQKVEFMIVGLSAAALQGAPVVTQDVDLWFRALPDPGLERALKKVRGSYVPPTARTAPMLAGKGIELFDIVLRMDGIGGFDEEKEHAIRVPLGRIKVLVLNLERIIASKKAAGRKKDKIVLKVLSDSLKTIRERERSRPRKRA